MPGHRDAVRVDLGERAQERESGERVAELVRLQQAQLQLVAGFLPVFREFPVQQVRG